MIFGNINNYSVGLFENNQITKYLELLKTITPETNDGRYELDNGAFYMVQTCELRPQELHAFETHKKYIDIQYVICGNEIIQFSTLDKLTSTVPYSEEKDIAFYTASVASTLILSNGDFAVFMPEDAHFPAIGSGTVKKVVVKIPLK